MAIAAPRCASLSDTLRLIPGYDPFRGAEAFHFDEDAAREVIDFFEKYLTHVKGELAGEFFVLEEWQKALLANLFGWKRADGTRRYREAFVFIPRKNGKSLLASGIGNYLLFMDGEPGAEIYAAAADREQARIVFEVAKQQVLRDPDLSAAAKVYAKSILLEEMASFFQAISSDANTKHGYNSHGVIIDELHAHKDRELVDVLLTSTGSRRQPLVVHITTSDYERAGSVCNEKHDYASKVRDAVFEDPHFLPVIYEAERGDDWTSPEVWRKANPCLGVSISEEYMGRECRRAQESPSYENTFKRLHLNIRTEQDVRWLSMEKWDACTEEVDEAALEGETCFAGLDLASTTDVAALALVFPVDGRYVVVPRFWLPRESIVERRAANAKQLLAWASQGFLELTDGNVIDYDVIRARIEELGDRYHIEKIAIDRWNATHISTQLTEEGFTVEGFGQGFASMSSPSKEFEAAVLGKKLVHGGHPVLRWMASNVSRTQDPAGNIKPDKAKSADKIDGIVAAIMGVGLAMATGTGGSIYDSQGLDFF